MRPKVPERILALQPYRPGKPIEEVERELGLTDSVKLASNENPLSPSRKVLDALRGALAQLNRYPDGGAVVLTEKLAARFGVSPTRVVLGNGSNEIIELVVRMFAGPGDEVVMSADGFLVYDLVTQAVGAQAVRVAAAGFFHDLEAMADAIGPRTRVVFVANPNNPTGTIVKRGAFEAFLARVPHDVVVACDEAYFEYVEDPDYPDSLTYQDHHPGLVTMRTFSKIHALAGLRLGYGVASTEIAGALARLRQPFNVNSLAQVAACAALEDDEYVEAARAIVREGRAMLALGLDALGLRHITGHANFVLVEVGDGSAVTESLLQRGVIVRPMGAYAMTTMIRVTYGTEAENQKFLAALPAALAEVPR